MNREARLVRLSLAFLALAAFGAFGGTVLDVLAFGAGERPGTLVVRGSRLEKCDFEDGEDLPLADFCENRCNTYMNKVHNSKQGDHHYG